MIENNGELQLIDSSDEKNGGIVNNLESQVSIVNNGITNITSGYYIQNQSYKSYLFENNGSINV